MLDIYGKKLQVHRIIILLERCFFLQNTAVHDEAVDKKLPRQEKVLDWTVGQHQGRVDLLALEGG